MAIQSTFQAVNKMLKMNKTLAYLDLSRNGISDSDVCSVFQALQHNTALVHLDLHNFSKYISDEVALLRHLSPIVLYKYLIFVQIRLEI